MQQDPDQVNWGAIRARPGQYACPVHGLVEPRRRVVPACPHCGRAVHLAVAGPGGLVLWQEPQPATCAGPGRHSLKPGRFTLGSDACSCSPTGLHRTWTCRECGDVQQWPAHDESTAAPYFGPGSRHA